MPASQAWWRSWSTPLYSAARPRGSSRGAKALIRPRGGGAVAVESAPGSERLALRPPRSLMTTIAPARAGISRWARLKTALTPAEWRRAGGLAAAIIALHAVRFFLLLVLVVPHGYRLGTGGAFGLGIGITAYTLGLRHAFDADHIGAIDNTTRKLMADGQRPLTVGFFFSLGHSSIVFALAIGFTLGIRGLSGAVTDDGSWLHSATGLIGPTVSGAFLFLIGILNLLILLNILRIFRRMRHGEFDEQELEHQLDS